MEISISGKRVESDWQQFHSLNFPVQIDYPDEWLARSDRVSGKRQDILEDPGALGALASISCEPIADWVRPEDYAHNVLDGLKSNVDKNAKIIGEEEGNKTLNSLQDIKVDGLKTFIVAYDKKRTPISIGSRHHLLAIFLDQGHGWEFDFGFIENYSTSPPYEKAYLDRVNQFRGMLSSLRFVR